MSEDPIGFGGGGNFYPYVQNDPEDWGDDEGTQRDRGTTGRPDGTSNPFKKLRPDPDDPSKVIYKDPHTGTDKRKAKPPGFDDYWKKKHPQQQPKPDQCPAKPDGKPEPSKSVGPDSIPLPPCTPSNRWDYCPDDGPIPNPNLPWFPPIQIPQIGPLEFPIRIPIFAFA